MDQKIKVGAKESGARLDIFLHSQNGKSRSYWQKQIKNGFITVNGATQKAGYILERGDKISISIPLPEMSVFSPPKLDILFEDNQVIVINKPAGVLVHDIPGRENQEPTIAAFMRTKTTEIDNLRAGIVHRLDKDTSGVMILAKDAKTKEFLQNQFRNREIKKRYNALLVGRLKEEEAVIELPIARDTKNPLKRTVRASGKSAITVYKVLAYYTGFTYLEAFPKTGRTHQLRVHFSHLGHPIAGDTLYGDPKGIKRLKQQFLHAREITFKHPSGQVMHFEADLPNNLSDFLKSLE